jgi:cytidine deaminase
LKPADPTVQEMLRRAKAAAGQAYCPYSRFAVGAAVLASRDGESGGEIFACGYRRLLAIVVYTPTATPTAPCGACRQFLFEFGPDAEVFGFAASGRYSRNTVAGLLPDAFGPSDLE